VGGIVYEQISSDRKGEAAREGVECKLCDIVLHNHREGEEHKRSEKHKFRTMIRDVLNRKSRLIHSEKKGVCYNCGAPGHIADECPTGFCVKYAISECRRETCQLAHVVL
jgi:hypothetical protein